MAPALFGPGLNPPRFSLPPPRRKRDLRSLQPSSHLASIVAETDETHPEFVRRCGLGGTDEVTQLSVRRGQARTRKCARARCGRNLTPKAWLDRGSVSPRQQPRAKPVADTAEARIRRPQLLVVARRGRRRRVRDTCRTERRRRARHAWRAEPRRGVRHGMR